MSSTSNVNEKGTTKRIMLNEKHIYIINKVLVPAVEQCIRIAYYQIPEK